MTTRFSVIIPTYIEERVIQRTLKNLKRAIKDHDVEIIVVDSDSPDRTREIASSLNANVINLDKRGISLARNAGARIATGDVLVFIDADSLVPNNFFNRLDIELTDFDVIGLSCNMMPDPNINPTFFEYFFYKVWSTVKIFAHKLKPCTTGENGIIIRTSVFNKIGGFNEDLPVIEDLDFVFRASKHGKFPLLRDTIIKDSIRRFRKIGAASFIRIYLSNWIYYTFMGSSKIKEWHPVR